MPVKPSNTAKTQLEETEKSQSVNECDLRFGLFNNSAKPRGLTSTGEKGNLEPRTWWRIGSKSEFVKHWQKQIVHVK